MSKTIKLQGKRNRYALVSDADHANLHMYSWYYCHGYAVRFSWKQGKKSQIPMHRQIMRQELNASEDKKLIDHINGNTLDNRKENLRLVNHAENTWNRKPSWNRPNKTSRYKGVARQLCPRTLKSGEQQVYSYWSANITKDNQQYYLGITDDEELAAKIYDLAARLLFGSFAYLNFPNDKLEDEFPELMSAPLP